ncbi:MAG: hypothetical protein JRH20_21885 [Deltaproteobacteria bacterium]|nr:hypothetical protein [Deltaproteobacteria bacterium]
MEMRNRYAAFEAQALTDDRKNNLRFGANETVRLAANLSFEALAEEKGRQSYLIRFAPGSVRSNFVAEKSAALARPAGVDKTLARKMGQEWAGFIARGMIPMSHFENLIALNTFRDYVMTDYADIVPIGRFPFRDRNPHTLTGASLRALTEMPGYKEKTHFPAFRAGLLAGLRNSGRLESTTLAKVARANSTENIANLLWDDHLELEYYRQQRKTGWIPKALTYYAGKYAGSEIRDPGFFGPPLVEELKKRRKSAEREIAEDKERLHDGKKEYAKQEAELKEILNHPRVWMRRRIAEGPSWTDRRQARYQIDHRLRQLTSYISTDYSAWVARIEADIKRRERRIKGLDETGFDVEGIQRLVRSPRFKRVLDHGMDYRSRCKEVAYALGDTVGALTGIRCYLEERVATMWSRNVKTKGSEQIEARRNRDIARKRVATLRHMDPYAFHQQMIGQPETIHRLMMLPYHTAKVALTADTGQMDAYVECGAKVIELRDKGKLDR